MSRHGHNCAAAHGTLCRYQGGCRCDDCRWANSAAHEQWRVHTTAAVPHGTTGGYGNYGCRCDDCLFAKAVQNRLEAEERAELEGRTPRPWNPRIGVAR